MTPAELALAEQVATQMATALAAFLQKKSMGTLTMVDVQAAADQTGLDLIQLGKDIANAKP